MSDEAPRPRKRARTSTIRRKLGHGNNEDKSHNEQEQTTKRHRTHSSLRRRQKPSLRPDTCLGGSRPGLGLYEGSYRANIAISNPAAKGSMRAETHPSVSHIQLQPLLSGHGDELESYGLHEFRDGFFDATFIKPREFNHDGVPEKNPKQTPNPLLHQVSRLQQVIKEISTTRAGVRLLKSFLGFFICYVLCLIPVVGAWLGPYNYLIVVAALINHPGRSIGSQIDGAVFTGLGAILGLLWGSFAVWLASSSMSSRAGFGAAVVPLLILFTLITSWSRCMFDRLYQAVLASGIAFFYIALSEDYSNPAFLASFIKRRITDFLVPTALGQAVCLIVCFAVFPSAGNRPLVLALHSALGAVRQSLVLPRPDSPALKRTLAWHFVNVSQATRDFALDLTYSPFANSDCVTLRNQLQAVIRASLAFRPSSGQFLGSGTGDDLATRNSEEPHLSGVDAGEPSACVNRILGPPTWRLVQLCQESIDIVDYIILSTAGFGKSADVTPVTGDAIQQTIAAFSGAQKAYDDAEALLMEEQSLRSVPAKDGKVVDLFVFMHPIRQAADKIYTLLVQAQDLHTQGAQWALRLPSYPWSKAMFRMNTTVRHDRGGLTAAYYFGSKRQLEKIMRQMQSQSWTPLNRYSSKQEWEREDAKRQANGFSYSMRKWHPLPISTAYHRLLHDIWLVLHRLQDFEARFALKQTIVCTLLSIPAFLPQSSGWWYANDCWWTVVSVWVMMHPRIGGNLSDLLIRCSTAALGAVWAGLAHAAGRGNPIVVGAFALIYGIPMIHRYTLSNHPRSGVIGCLSFSIVSLIINNHNGDHSIVHLAWTRGLGIVVGVIVAIIVNWILWPFIARHELRKSIASMILHSALVYRRILAIYIYYNEGDEPTAEDIQVSEMLEGRIREGVVRARQLMSLTKHEIRIRGPFEPLPYARLIDRCEEFFDRLIDVRQATLFSKPYLMKRTDNAAHNLFVLRRDAVASVLMILYVLAGALRERRPLPRYLPSAALSRQQLLDTMELVQEENTAAAAEDASKNIADGRALKTSYSNNWGNIYHYTFSGALTDCIEQVQYLVDLTRTLVGEVGSSTVHIE